MWREERQERCKGRTIGGKRWRKRGSGKLVGSRRTINHVVMACSHVRLQSVHVNLNRERAIHATFLTTVCENSMRCGRKYIYVYIVYVDIYIYIYIYIYIHTRTRYSSRRGISTDELRCPGCSRKLPRR